ncbi:unnamed protein product [Brachionus calyciflorus]|uniref:Uncharacterized protein n=1 Tax=Brachionus calyciflorus TaxID=104777 RepID=A0A813ZLP4_9BILA|nr:unnamed protein product [Brachionus calyciflorus]
MESYHFNEDQLEYLKDFFEKNKIPNQDYIEKIRKNLGKEISKRDISIGFYKFRLSQNKNDQTFEEMDTNFSKNNQSIDFDSEILKKNMRCSIISSKIETKNPIINKQMKKGRKNEEDNLFNLSKDKIIQFPISTNEIPKPSYSNTVIRTELSFFDEKELLEKQVSVGYIKLEKLIGPENELEEGEIIDEDD